MILLLEPPPNPKPIPEPEPKPPPRPNPELPPNPPLMPPPALAPPLTTAAGETKNTVTPTAPATLSLDQGEQMAMGGAEVLTDAHSTLAFPRHPVGRKNHEPQQYQSRASFIHSTSPIPAVSSQIHMANWFLLFFFLVGLGFELRASHLQSKHSTA
jgi:hypothetical protein